MKTIKKKIAVGVSLATITAAIAILGNACGQMVPDDGVSAVSSKNSCSGNIAVEIIPGAETASIAYGKQVLDNMVACTGLQVVSQKTLDEFDSRRGSLSEFGNVMDVNPPLVMAHAAIAAEVCDDLLKEELALNSADRRIFNAISGAAAPSLSDAQETMRRMARACWDRDETQEEHDLLLQNVMDIVDSSAADSKSRHAAIAICTSVLASLDGYRM